MEVIVMRHGERDYEPCHERGFIGQGLELDPRFAIPKQSRRSKNLRE